MKKRIKKKLPPIPVSEVEQTLFRLALVVPPQGTLPMTETVAKSIGANLSFAHNHGLVFDAVFSSGISNADNTARIISETRGRQGVKRLQAFDPVPQGFRSPVFWFELGQRALSEVIESVASPKQQDVLVCADSMCLASILWAVGHCYNAHEIKGMAKSRLLGPGEVFLVYFRNGGEPPPIKHITLP